MADTHTDSKGSKAQPIFGVENFEKSNDLGAQLNKKIVQKWQKKKGSLAIVSSVQKSAFPGCRHLPIQCRKRDCMKKPEFVLGLPS